MPLVILDNDTGANAPDWLHAHLSGDTAEVALVLGAQSLPLVPVPRPAVRLIRRGADLVASADEHVPATLWIGGRATRLLWLWPGETVLTLPEHVTSARAWRWSCGT